ncbi:NAD-binding protein [Paenibacillus kobensis]|uniref:NAD-binding protein n=1 Tax=Paenibacillus kobensis TaxID=59841 RepID=UPI000FD89C5F|nr:NAD-binding protein [Paenibacillus kobensis]
MSIFEQQQPRHLHHLSRSRLFMIWLIATAICITFSAVIGAIGYLHVEGFTAKQAWYSAFRLFSFDFDLPPEDHHYPMLLDIARWTAPITLLLSVLFAIFISLQQTLRVYSLAWSRSHYVVCGLNKYSYELVSDLLVKNKRVVVIEPDTDNPYLSKVQQIGAIVLIGESTDRRVAKIARIGQCKHLVLFSLDDTANIESLLKLCEMYDDEPAMSIHIHLSNGRYADFVDELTAEIKHRLRQRAESRTAQSADAAEAADTADAKQEKHLDIRAFNIHANTAKLLFQKYPLYECRGMFQPENADDVPHLMIIGFGETGEHVLLQAAQVAHFPHLRRLKVTIIDTETDDSGDHFKQRYPNLAQAVDYQLHRYNANGIHFHQFVERMAPHYIVVCASSDTHNLSIGMSLMAYCPNAPIHVKMSDDAYLALRIDQQAGKYERLRRFGRIKEVADEAVVINETLDVMARAVNETYNKLTNNNYKWEDLDMFTKSSNRRQADHIATKLYALGLEVSANTDEAALTEEQYTAAVPEALLEQLAISEHLRWNAFHYVHSWKAGAKNQKKNKSSKEHPALVDWDRLDEVSEVQSQLAGDKINYKEYDRDTIRNIHKVLKQAGCSIVRMQDTASSSS